MAFSFHLTIRFLCVIGIISAQWSYEDEEDFCKTPDKQRGTCIPIKQCKPIVDFLRQAPKPLSKENIEFSRRFTCGTNGGRKVCCPPGPIVSQQSIQQPPDVSSHRNINLLPKNCGIIVTLDRIINGNKTGLFEFPWMALLSYQTPNGPSFRCGGAVINDHYILTAAHCVTNLKYPLIGVRVGEHDIRTKVDCEARMDGSQECAPPAQDLAVEEVIPHLGYNRQMLQHDIGLVRVRRMNSSIESVGPVCLPLEEARNYNFDNRKVIVTGWGATETSNSSPDLLKVALPVVSWEYCRKTYEAQVPLSHRQMCAGGKDMKDSCGGDSGGPMQIVMELYDDSRYVQQGVVSFGPKHCGLLAEGYPGVYTRVDYYMDWILDNMRS